MSYQSNCKICKRHGNCDSEKEMEKTYPTHIVIGCSACEPKPMTNADRIRVMTDEELAIEETAKGGCPHDCETPDDMDTDCVRCWLDWLKQEVDNG